jgi:polyphenol oxidase
LIVETSQFKIYFGNSQDTISKPIDCVSSSKPLIAHKKFAPIAKQLSVDHLAFLNQTHSNQGSIITNSIPAFDSDGDFLIVSQPTIGIGVMTADCLPIVIYDPKNHVAATVHAGWPGSIGQIAVITLAKMRAEFGSKIEDIAIYFGPSAKRCCYQVSQDFAAKVAPFSYGSQCLITRDGQLYFDLPLFNILQLQELGIKESAIFREYNFCTICDHRFYSYRRQGESAGRQMSIVCLK